MKLRFRGDRSISGNSVEEFAESLRQVCPMANPGSSSLHLLAQCPDIGGRDAGVL